jgi:hypothetical protein
MDMDQAAVFLAGSILTALGFVVVAVAIICINNLLNKYWQPVRLFTSDSWSAFNPPPRYATDEEVKELKTDESKLKQ